MLVTEKQPTDVGDRRVHCLDDLVTIIRMNGGLFLKPKEVPEAETQPSPLSPRETDVLNHVAGGTPNKQIANLFDISEHTVKNHLTGIMHKLNARDRTHAVVIALRQGWLSI